MAGGDCGGVGWGRDRGAGPINGALARGIGGAMPAAAVSFGVGFLMLFALSVMQGQGAAFLRLGQVPLWMLAGGLLGAWYVFAAAGLALAGLVLSRL